METTTVDVPESAELDADEAEVDDAVAVLELVELGTGKFDLLDD